MSDHEAKQATPHATLLAELLDSRIPKSEREHAAAREVERLTAALRHEADCVEAANAEIERLTAEREEARAEREELRQQLAQAQQRAEYWKAEHLAGNKEIDELRRQLAEAELDARRYRWLRPRFFAADFAYSDPPVCAIVFRWPESAKISANLDREIDAAMGASNE